MNLCFACKNAYWSIQINKLAGKQDRQEGNADREAGRQGGWEAGRQAGNQEWRRYLMRLVKIGEKVHANEWRKKER